jgi:uncharacterized protein YlaI
VARYCDGPHIAVARWRTKAERNGSGITTYGWCDECKARMTMEVADRWGASDFEPIAPLATIKHEEK